MSAKVIRQGGVSPAQQSPAAKIDALDRRLAQGKKQLAATKLKVSELEQSYCAKSAELGKVQSRRAALDVRSDSHRILADRLAKETHRPVKVIVAEEKARLAAHAEHVLGGKDALLQAVTQAVGGKKLGHSALAKAVKAAIKTQESAIGRLPPAGSKELRRLIREIERAGGDKTVLLATLGREQGALQSERSEAKARIRELAKLLVALEGPNPPTREQIIADEQRRLAEVMAELKRLAEIEARIKEEIDRIAMQLAATRAMQRLLEDELAAREAERAERERRSAEDQRQADERERVKAAQEAQRQLRLQVAEQDKLRRLHRAAQEHVQEVQRELAKLEQYEIESARVDAQRTQQATELAALAETRRADIKRLHETFDQAIESLRSLQRAWLQHEHQEWAEIASQDALAASVASFLRGIAASAENNDSIAVPAGVRVAAANVSAMAVAGIDQVLGDIGREVIENAEDKELAAARKSVAWGLSHGLMPHPDDVARLLESSPFSGKGWADQFADLGEELSILEGRRFGHGQLQAHNGGERISLIREEARLLENLGAPVLVALVADPRRAEVPPPPRDAGAPDIGRIIDDLFGGS